MSGNKRRKHLGSRSPEEFLKNALEKDVNNVYESTLELLTLCKKSVQVRDTQYKDALKELEDKDKQINIAQGEIVDKEIQLSAIEDEMKEREKQFQEEMKEKERQLEEALREIKDKERKFKLAIKQNNEKVEAMQQNSSAFHQQEFEQEIVELKRKLKESEEDNLKTKILLKSASEEVTVKLQDKKILQDCKEELRTSQIELIEAKSQIQKLKSFKEESSLLKIDNQTLKMEVASLKTECDTLDSLLQTYGKVKEEKHEKCKEERNNLIKEHDDKVKGLTNALKDKTDNVKVLSKAMEKLNEQLKSLSYNQEVTNAKEEQFQKMLQEKDSSFKAREMEFEILTKNYTDTITMMSAKLSEKDSAMKACEKETEMALAVVTEKLNDKNKEVDSLMKTIDSMKDEKFGSKLGNAAEVIKMKKVLEKSSLMFQEDRNIFRDLIKNKEKKIAELEKEKLSLEDELSKQHQNDLTVAMFKGKIKKYEEESINLKSEMKKCTEKTLQVIQEKSSAHEMEVAEKDTKISELEKENSSIKLDMMNISDNFTKSLASKEAKIEEFQAGKGKMDKEMESLSKKLRKKKKEIKSLERKNSERKKKVKRLEEKHFKLNDRYKRAIQGFRDEFERQNNKKQQQITLKFLNILMENHSESTKLMKINFGHSFSKKEKSKTLTAPGKEALEDENVVEKQVISTMREIVENIGIKETESGKSAKSCVEENKMNEDVSINTSSSEEKLLEDEISIVPNEKDGDLLTEAVSGNIDIEMSENLYEIVLKEVMKDMVCEELDQCKVAAETVHEILDSTLDFVWLKIDERESNQAAQKACVDKFNIQIIDTVKNYLMNFYHQPSDNLKQLTTSDFKIQTKTQFINLCKKFSNQFQEELKVSYYSIHESFLGIHLTPDSVMYIHDQINIYFDEIGSKTVTETGITEPVVTIIHD